jgi:hypothetical protein
VILVIDIDGTLANLEHRLHFIDKENPTSEDWDKFFDPELVIKDTPIELSQEALEACADYFDDIVFLTGRIEDLRELTETWLDEYYGIDPDEDHLFMRPQSNELTEDTTEWADFKKIVFEEEIKPRYPGEEFIFIDDTDEILKMLAPYGLTLKAPECWELLLHEDK